MKKILFFILCINSICINAQELYFPPIIGDEWETTDPASLGWCLEKIDSLYNFLDETNSKSFILLKDGKIVLEKYFDGFTQDSLWYWASAGKTITSFLTGIAQENGILNINDKSSDYLGQGWTSMDLEKEDLITIRDQISMTTGMDEFADECLTPECFIYKVDAGERWFYHNTPYTKMRHVLEAASGQDYNVFTFQNLLSKTGMTGLWVWFQEKNLYLSKARSMARFGLLNLANGTWDGNPILADMGYLEAMKNTSQDLNESYGYLWWLNGKDSYKIPVLDIVFDGMLNENAPNDLYSGLGKNGQFLDISPSEGLVVVRMGDNPDNSLVPVIYHRNLWEKINDVICTSSVGQTKNDDDWHVVPNPFSENLQVNPTCNLCRTDIYNLEGKLLISTTKNNVITSHLPSGVYIVKTHNESGTRTTKMIKN